MRCRHEHRFMQMQDAAASDEGPESDIPEPPHEPLPKLAALSRAPPSPLLAWQAAELLYAYCLTLLVYNGDWRADPQVLLLGVRACPGVPP